MKKLWLLILILVGSITSNAQHPDTTKTHIGYDLDWSYIYARVDTVHCMTYIYNYYPRGIYTKGMYFSVNNNDSLYVSHHGVFTVWKTNFVLYVRRNNYEHKYLFKE